MTSSGGEQKEGGREGGSGGEGGVQKKNQLVRISGCLEMIPGV